MPTWAYYIIAAIVIFFILWIFNDGTSVTPNFPTEFLEQPTTVPKVRREDLPPVRVFMGRKYGSKCEEIACCAVEEMFGKDFVSVRPNWLRNPETGSPMEIDCYNDELKLGIEYQGYQHYKFPNRFHGNNKEAFMAQVRRDQYKVEICNEKNVYLIRVPYDVPPDEIKEYIRARIPHTLEHLIIK